jgi:hypothetical protein
MDVHAARYCLVIAGFGNPGSILFEDVRKLSLGNCFSNIVSFSSQECPLIQVDVILKRLYYPFYSIRKP